MPAQLFIPCPMRALAPSRVNWRGPRPVSTRYYTSRVPQLGLLPLTCHALNERRRNFKKFIMDCSVIAGFLFPARETRRFQIAPRTLLNNLRSIYARLEKEREKDLPQRLFRSERNRKIIYLYHFCLHFSFIFHLNNFKVPPFFEDRPA